MKSSVKIIVMILMLLLLPACKKQENNADSLEFYILRMSEDKSEFILEEEPIFTGADIKSYDWDKHIITFTDEFLSSSNSEEVSDTDSFIMGGSNILGVYYPDQFALYLNGKELYRGYFRPQAYISFMPMGPIVSDVENGIIINCIGQVNDPRDNEELHKFLKENGLLR